jgi:hypothetical protein
MPLRWRGRRKPMDIFEFAMDIELRETGTTRGANREVMRAIWSAYLIKVGAE